MAKQPMQPLEEDEHGILRFKKNAIVCFLLDNGPLDMNIIAQKQFSQEDREQFAQLIGYSLSGFGELNYVSNDTYETAKLMYEKQISEQEARITHLESLLSLVRDNFKQIIPQLFHIHSDDLKE